MPEKPSAARGQVERLSDAESIAPLVYEPAPVVLGPVLTVKHELVVTDGKQFGLAPVRRDDRLDREPVGGHDRRSWEPGLRATDRLAPIWTPPLTPASKRYADICTVATIPRRDLNRPRGGPARLRERPRKPTEWIFPCYSRASGERCFKLVLISSVAKSRNRRRL